MYIVTRVTVNRSIWQVKAIVLFGKAKQIFISRDFSLTHHGRILKKNNKQVHL